jgi:hypothetical protein
LITSLSAVLCVSFNSFFFYRVFIDDGPLWCHRIIPPRAARSQLMDILKGGGGTTFDP